MCGCSEGRYCQHELKQLLQKRGGSLTTHDQLVAESVGGMAPCKHLMCQHRLLQKSSKPASCTALQGTHLQLLAFASSTISIPEETPT